VGGGYDAPKKKSPTSLDGLERRGVTCVHTTVERPFKAAMPAFLRAFFVAQAERRIVALETQHPVRL
jgi:hypothetical protein